MTDGLKINSITIVEHATVKKITNSMNGRLMEGTKIRMYICQQILEIPNIILQ